MRYLSVCSGIEAASVAWHPLGWTPAAFSEIEAFPRAVLQQRWPEVPLHGDFTTIRGDEYGPIDLLVGGTPCQSFSVAGLRRGLADERGNLSLEFLRLAQRTRPRWVVWENVPGVFSSITHDAPHPSEPPAPLDVELDGQEVESSDAYDADESHAFSCFLAGLSELGYGCAYRVLDAQYVRVDGYARAVPQRRKRVFLVGHLGDWRRPTAVLLERESLSGHPAPRREARERAAPTLAARTRGGGGLGTDAELDGALVADTLTSNGDAHSGYRDERGLVPQVSPALKARDYKGPSSDGDGDGAPLLAVAHPLLGKPNSSHDTTMETLVAQTITADMYRSGGAVAGNNSQGVRNCFPVAIQERAISENPDAGPDGVGVREDSAAYTLESRTVPQAVAFDWQAGGSGDTSFRGKARSYIVREDGNAGSLQVNKVQAALLPNMAVRRLTPRECERLQGFPDDYTLITHRKKAAADGPRYKALGNSMAVNVMRWIGRRIQAVEAIPCSE